MDILGQIANPRMANIAQAIDVRQQRVKEQQDALAKVEMGRAIAKALPNLQEGTASVSYTHLTLPTKPMMCRSRWSPYH